MDYAAISYYLHINSLPYPRIVAGQNLMDGVVGNLIKYITKFDFLKAGAIPIQRSKSKDLKKFCDVLGNLLAEEKSVLVFPESSDGKTGRSYDGKAREFASALFSAPINAALQGKDVYVVPMSVSYDFIPESHLFPALQTSARLRRSKRNTTRLLGNMVYMWLESRSFLYDIFNGGKGNIYIDFAQPINAKDFAKNQRKELALLAQESSLGSYRATSPAILSHVLIHKQSDDLTLQCKQVEKQLFEKGRNLAVTDYHLTINDFLDRNILGWDHRGLIEIRQPGIVEYYANTIEHLLV